MKIIIIQHLFLYSGASSLRMIGYAKSFVQKGHEVVLIVSPQKPIPTHLDGIRFVEIQEDRRSIWGILRSYRYFVKTIKKEYDNDSIILFYESQPYSFLFRSSKYRVFSEQTEIPYCGYNPPLKHRIIERFKLYAIKHFTGIVAISKGLRDYYLKQGIKNVEVINMFVDASRFENVTVHPVEKYIAYCGTISVAKDGVDALIKAFVLLKQHFPDYKLYLIGQFDLLGSEGIVRSLISENGLEDSVILKGLVEAEEMPALLSGARMLALARPNNKQAQYGFPTKLGEYLATGKPVVVTAVGEIPLYLKDGENAFIVKPDDIQSFASKLLEVENNYDKAMEIGKRGQQLVYSAFSSEVQSEKFLSFIEKSINKNN